MVSLSTIREAVNAIPCDLPYADWANVGRAIYSELGPSGIDVFDSWSQGGSTYHPNKVASQYRSFKTTTNVSIGTLFYHAKQYGWSERRDTIDTVKSKAQLRIDAHMAAKTRKSREIERKVEEAKREVALFNLRGVFDSLLPGKGVYLERKIDDLFTPNDEIRCGNDFIIYPLKDTQGTIRGFQQLYDNGFKKVTGKQSGNYFVLGELTDFAYIVEGLATGITIQAATNHPVIVCLNAGNIPKVVEAIRLESPLVEIVGASDNDQWPGNNGKPSYAGKIYSEKSGIQYSMPDFTQWANTFSGMDNKNKPTDFNDLYKLGGIKAVQDQICDGFR